MGFGSLKTKITVLTVGIIGILFAMILLVNNIFIERYYQNEKINDIVGAYHTIDEIMQKYDCEQISDDELHHEISWSTNPLGVSLFIMDSSWETVYSSKAEDNDERERVKENVFMPDGIKSEVIMQGDNYTVQKAFDRRLNDYYIELVGSLTDGNIAMLRMPIGSIKESVRISNRFIAYVGIFILILSVVFVYLYSAWITKPVKSLSNIAERMSELDFSAKYEGKDKSELGLLGNSMNSMSESLEKNIAQLKSANLELKKDIENKIQIEEMRSDFIANVSHELKTPIALIQGYAEGLKEGISDDPENIEYYCDVIMDEAGKMNALVKKLLTLNQLEAGEEIALERFDITELTEGIINSNSIRMEQNNIKVVFDVKDACCVWADEYKIEAVITNYLSNAINHCQYDKIIKITIQRIDDVVRVSVFNTGDNIPEADIDKIWDKFYKVDKARTREYGGNGIGLSIVKAIMNAHDKKFGVINHSNGVEFWFEVDSD